MSIVGNSLPPSNSRGPGLSLRGSSFTTGTLSSAEPAAPLYSLFGLQISSEILLPVPPVTGRANVRADCVVRRAAVGAIAVPEGPVIATKYREDGTVQSVRHQGKHGQWICNREIGTFHISADASQVMIFAEPEADDQLLSMMVLGQIAVFLLHHRGLPCLHASAVRTLYGTAAFLGVHGQGKSTMAACFLRRGAELLTDDVLPVRPGPEGVMAGPSVPIMKMWPQTVSEGLAFSEPLPNLLRGLDKKLLAVGNRYPVVHDATRLSAIYVLYRFDPEAAGTDSLHIRQLTHREALTALLSQTSWSGLYSPAEVARVMPVFLQVISQTPVRLLGYPNGFEHQDAVYTGILQDLQSL
jgi:hypothetical protein